MSAALDRWSSPPPNPSIALGQVHVWRSRLHAPVAELWECLSPDELDRARRYRLPRDQDRFAAGRVFLRQIPARYLDIEPRLVRFRYSAHGRPSIDPGCLRDQGLTGLDLNLTHSEDRALLALGMGVGVGIDLERIDPAKADEGMLGLVCSASELRLLASLPRQEQVACFYQCWTRKEDYLKARGDGLILPMSDISVLRTDGQPAAVNGPSDGSGRPASWNLADLSTWPGFAASLALAVSQDEAVHVDSQSVRLWDWRQLV